MTFTFPDRALGRDFYVSKRERTFTIRQVYPVEVDRGWSYAVLHSIVKIGGRNVSMPEVLDWLWRVGPKCRGLLLLGFDHLHGTKLA